MMDKRVNEKMGEWEDGGNRQLENAEQLHRKEKWKFGMQKFF